LNPANGLATLNLTTEYRTGENDPVLFFYKPCLDKAIEYKRAVGYFRSTIFLIVGTDILNFAKKGGKIKLICSPSLSKVDIENIEIGYEERIRRIDADISDDIDFLLNDVDYKNNTKILATLIALGYLDIKIAIRPDSQGQYHEKIGVFKDNYNNLITFIGSANETWSAWHSNGNHEAIEIFRSWESENELSRNLKHDSYFDKLWNGLVSGIETLDFPSAAKQKLLQNAATSIDDLELLILNNKNKINNNSSRKPFPHQVNAIAAWENNGRRGIFEHATGSGKTFTAILAISKHVENRKRIAGFFRIADSGRIQTG